MFMELALNVWTVFLQVIYVHVYSLAFCRGEVAFCSLECRQQQMNLDEQREKCSPTSMKDTPSPTDDTEQSGNGGTATAA